MVKQISYLVTVLITLTFSLTSGLCEDFSKSHKGEGLRNLIGLVEIPALFGTTDPNGPPGIRPPKVHNPIPVYERPNYNAKVSTLIHSPDALTSAEHGYEQRSAVTYDRRDGWFRIKSTTVSGWISPKHVGVFRSYESLLRDGLHYLTENWNGQIYSSPTELKTFEAREHPTERRDADVVIVGEKMIRDRLWLHVRLGMKHCSETPPEEKTEGWIPAMNDHGLPNVWFYSRGC